MSKLNTMLLLPVALRQRMIAIGMSESRHVMKAAKVLLAAAVLVFGLHGTPAWAANGPFGVGVHSIMLDAPAQRAELDAAVGLGFDSIRTDAQWKYVEKTRGVLTIPASWDSFVEMAIQRGLKPILILDYGNQFYDGADKPRSAEAIAAYARYAGFVAKHFVGKVKIYEVWNEWDNTTGGFPPGSPEDYAKVFAPAYSAIKNADSSATVLVSSGISQDWYLHLAQNGVVAKGDGVSVHPYNYEPALAPETSAQSLMALESMMASRAGLRSVDIYVTEIGWPTRFGLRGYDQARVRDFASRTPLLLSALPFIKGVWWYDLVDDGTEALNKQHHFGLLQFDRQPKEASKVIAGVSSILNIYDLSLSPLSSLKDGLVIIAARDRRSGKSAAIAWNVLQKPLQMDLDCHQAVKALGLSATKAGADALGSAPSLITSKDGRCSSVQVDSIRN